MIEPVRVNNREWFETHLNLFQHQAHLWNEQGRSDGLLLRGDALQMAEQQAAQIALNANEKAFLEACRAQRQREQRDIYQRRLIAAGFVVSLFLFFVAVFFSISASMANRTSQLEAMNAQAASTQAFLQFSTAQAANTLAFSQQATAQAASTLAIAQSDNARFASSQAIANAEAAATARQQAEAEKREAEAQRRAARANELAVQSILARNNKQASIASLLAVEAFQMIDSPRTRIQLLSAVGASGLLVGVANNTGATSTLAFDPAGQSFFSNNFYICPADSQYFVCRQGIFRRWALTPLSGPHARGLFQMSLVYTFSSPGDMLDAIALRPDASQIASVFCTPTQNNIVRCEKLKLQMWDSGTDERLGAEILLAENAYNSRKVLLAYSPDASRLAVAFNDEILVIFDAQTYQEQARFDLNNGISQFAFSPDSRLLAFTSGLDTTLTLIDLPGQEQREVNILAETRALVSLAYAPDGQSLALGSRDGLILFWDVASQSVTGQVYGRQGQVLSLAFSPDGKILASGHETYHLILWDVPSRQPLLRPIFRHTDAVRSLAFSQDGTKLLSAGREIILWNMLTDFWVEKACAQAGRNFSLQEWQQYFPGEAYRITCSQWPPGK
jgi:WD40 repeat protein